MSDNFFLRFPRQDRGEVVRLRYAGRTGRFGYIRPSAHRLSSQLKALGKGCLVTSVVVMGCGLAGGCWLLFLIIFAN